MKSLLVAMRHIPLDLRIQIQRIIRILLENINLFVNIFTLRDFNDFNKAGKFNS